ncbi:hypothetical protein NQ318_015759 [Aromia moschata]|uniref:Uncharacterized protein n=1 Tax=Aromia moschata TaxID=1265417 RepID=A0AAV8XNA2_9CUCU|nr:hypothetical protein NQ318_015759 [Aromia moschata]
MESWTRVDKGKLGININFLENMEDEIRLSEERHELQQRLDSMCQLLEKLQHTQHTRLSAPPPPHLNQCPPPPRRRRRSQRPSPTT